MIWLPSPAHYKRGCRRGIQAHEFVASALRQYKRGMLFGGQGACYEGPANRYVSTLRTVHHTAHSCVLHFLFHYSTDCVMHFSCLLTIIRGSDVDDVVTAFQVASPCVLVPVSAAKTSGMYCPLPCHVQYVAIHVCHHCQVVAACVSCVCFRFAFLS